MEDHFTHIKDKYENSHGDSTALFQEILNVADEIGFDRALAYLGECVIQKRPAWFDRNHKWFKTTGQPVWDGYRLFYETYLGLSIPGDGEIVKRTDQKIVTRWWNPCPTLDACQKLGLDTRMVCKKAYQVPVQTLLVQVHPKLRFDRNYACIRPYAPYCEEIIYLEE
jgi:hypothetical protein